jgi:hypothetical protein
VARYGTGEPPNEHGEKRCHILSPSDWAREGRRDREMARMVCTRALPARADAIAAARLVAA